MTSVDEDLLLNGDGDDLDNITTFDEEALLNGEPARKSPFDEIKVEQDDDDQFHQSSTTIDESSLPEKENLEDSTIFEVKDEELDYDDDEEEDEEKRERTSRFASEKRKEDRSSEDPDNDDDSKPKIPSLFEKDIKCPFKEHKQIAVKLRFEGETEERIFLPKPNFPGKAPTIVPRLPNGIPLISTGSTLNHGSAGFGPTYLEKMEGQRAAGGMGMAHGHHNIHGNGVHWDQAVEMFLHGDRKRGRGNTTTKRSRRARSSSSERSYSSYSSYSSRSRSRSRSYSPKRRRDSDRDRRDRKRSRKDSDSRRDRKKPSNEDRKRKERHATIESAQALGLSNEYLDKMKEQKRQRDEIVRRKEERRNGTGSDIKKSSSSSALPQPSTSSSSVVASAGSANDRDKKLKAYLVVNINGLKQLPTGVKKVEQLANDLGPIKKCWKSTDDIVSVIFNAHDKAKDFMIKYNNKVITGLRVGVSLEKKWLNISEMA